MGSGMYGGEIHGGEIHGGEMYGSVSLLLNMILRTRSSFVDKVRAYGGLDAHAF